ncbi:hypothetical protein Maq22A_c28600 [Methylobacterium aquaticum]|uniref:Uncharacterized protein n=1 Tax=Methylobacterium aquaticum TaxID=270351 RepID=A0A1Y0ZGA1_9HYPH|nr:hypothetical protein Maq22A_c28600 [Methylobacterium aquaticum]
MRGRPGAYRTGGPGVRGPRPIHALLRGRLTFDGPTPKDEVQSGARPRPRVEPSSEIRRSPRGRTRVGPPAPGSAMPTERETSTAGKRRALARHPRGRPLVLPPRGA